MPTISTGFQGLWITDGTTAGTREIGGARNQAVFDSGVSNFIANDFVTLGDDELFNADSAGGDSALWITDGTATGTKEIGGANNAGVGGGDNSNLGGLLDQSVLFGNRISSRERTRTAELASGRRTARPPAPSKSADSRTIRSRPICSRQARSGSSPRT